LLGIAATGAGLYAITNLKAVVSQYDELIGGAAEAAVMAARANNRTMMIRGAIYRAIVETTDEGIRTAEKERVESVASFKKILDSIKTIAPQTAGPVNAFIQGLDSAMAQSCASVLQAVGQPKRNEMLPQIAADMGKTCAPVLDEMVLKTRGFVDEMIKESRRQSDGIGMSASMAITYTYIVLFGSITAVLALAVFVVMTTLTSPLKVLVDAMAKMSKGDLAVVVQGADRKDEIGSVARTLEVFRSGLLETEQLRMEAQATEAQNAEKLRKARHQIADQFQAKMAALADAFGKSSHEVSEAARNLSATAEETARQAQAVSGAAEEASVNVQTVAASTEEMTASVREIASQVSKSAAVANTAASEAARTESDVRALSEAATKIGEVVELINNIAGQTNLLALNATIEAARAGEAGKGFAVVASEVKQLAAQTAKATEEISSKINEIQQATNRTVGSIERIVNTVSDIQSISTMISAAIEEQGAATGEIASNTQLAARGTE
jgi:methyl-accepting chemotaxis protein